MKHLCCNRLFLLLLLAVSTALQASPHDKGAIIYLGKRILYPMIGVHDYIIINPDKNNVYTHEFKVYNKKIYTQLLLTSKSTLKTTLQQIIAFAKSFGFSDSMLLQELGIETKDSGANVQRKIIHKDTIMDFEIKNPISGETLYFTPPESYVLFDDSISEINNENMWIVNPFEYFKQAILLKYLPIPENSSRLFFSYIDEGYTTISNTKPWLTFITPLGIAREKYYQIYWGFKKVVSTFLGSILIKKTKNTYMLQFLNKKHKGIVDV